MPVKLKLAKSGSNKDLTVLLFSLFYYLYPLS